MSLGGWKRNSHSRDFALTKSRILQSTKETIRSMQQRYVYEHQMMKTQCSVIYVISFSSVLCSFPKMWVTFHIKNTRNTPWTWLHAVWCIRCGVCETCVSWLLNMYVCVCIGYNAIIYFFIVKRRTHSPTTRFYS